MSAQPRIVVVGAGPAGVRAAQALVDAGLRPVVIDEGLRDGGQIYRRQPDGFTRSYAKLYGSEADKAEALHRDFDALRAQLDYRPRALAWNLSPGLLHVVQDGQGQHVPFDALLLCSGASDRLMPVPGWNLAGCYSLGASQIALKSQACAIGSQVVFMGSGPLLYLVASQYVAAGANVVAVLDTAPARPSLAALRGLASRPLLALRGLGLVRGLRRAGVALRKAVQPLRIEGTPDDGVHAVVVRSARGEERFACDAVGMGWHLRSEAQLADLGRCEFRFDAPSRQWLPKIDEDGRASVPGLYLAGDGVRILGADGAEAAGRLAALTALADLDLPGAREHHARQAPALRATLDRMQRFQRGLGAAFPWPHEHAARLPDATVVCRCEVITAGELRACVNGKDAQEVNRAKAFSRVGMGRCQGRYCGHAAAEIIAAAADVPIDTVGRIRTQAPVKPLQMNVLQAEPDA